MQSVLMTQCPDDSTVGDRFKALLEDCRDRAGLEHLAAMTAYDPPVVIPVYERLLRLDPEAVSLILQFGHVLFMAGEDDAATAQLNRAKEMEGETARVLKLEALLARTDKEKQLLYTRIMALDPSDREIWQYLIALNR